MSRQLAFALFLGLLTTNASHSTETVATLFDRQAIAEAVASYAYLWDRKDSVGVSELFASDGAIDWVFGKKPGETVIRGREDILAYARKAHTERLAGKQSRHHFTNLVFKELNATDAVTEHMVLVTHQMQGGRPVNVATGYYRIAWTKVDGRWLIGKRTLFLDH